MPIGTVKWFNNAKGYGFILPEGGGEDLFVHYSAIQMDGFRTLRAGQSVAYEPQAGDKGHQAVNVVPDELRSNQASERADDGQARQPPLAAGSRSY